jgi:hypothetical protein
LLSHNSCVSIVPDPLGAANLVERRNGRSTITASL